MFITDYGATSHMVNLEENMKNFKDEKTQVTVEDSKTLTRKNVAIGTAGRNVTKIYIARH